jgi:hypothetical protein
MGPATTGGVGAAALLLAPLLALLFRPLRLLAGITVISAGFLIRELTATSDCVPKNRNRQPPLASCLWLVLLLPCYSCCQVPRLLLLVLLIFTLQYTLRIYIRKSTATPDCVSQNQILCSRSLAPVHWAWFPATSRAWLCCSINISAVVRTGCNTGLRLPEFSHPHPQACWLQNLASLQRIEV